MFYFINNLFQELHLRIITLAPVIFIFWWSKFTAFLHKSHNKLPSEPMETLIERSDYKIALFPGTNMDSISQNAKLQKAVVKVDKSKYQEFQGYDDVSLPINALLETSKTSVYGMFDVIM